MKRYIFLILWIASSLSGISQIVYNKDGLSISGSGAVQPQDSSIIIRDRSGLYWRNVYTNCEFMINMSGEHPRIFGNGDYVDFFDTDKNSFVAVRCGFLIQTGKEAHDNNTHIIKSDLLDDVLSLRPVSYNWENESQSTGNGVEYGLIAQEVEQLFPELVITDGADGKFVDYVSLIPLLISSIQEVMGHIEQQEERIEILKQEINKLP